MKYFSLLSAFMIFLTAGCAWAGAKTANLFNNAPVIGNIAYGILPHQKLDIYLPEQTQDGRFPVIVFYHGGRWTYGTKDEHAFVAETLTHYGFVVVIPDYAKYPQVRFPVFVEDSAKALGWVHRNIEKYHGNPERLYISGHSAGAHIAALLAADPRYLKAEGAAPDIIKGFAGLAGPYQFTPDEPDLQAIFGPPENYPQMQVPNFIDGDEPPMLLLQGLDDDVVNRSNIDRLEAKIREKGGTVESKFYPGVDHLWIVGALSWLGKGKVPVAQDMIEFFNTHPITPSPLGRGSKSTPSPLGRGRG